MRWLINYFKSCFCKHDWELIFDGFVQGEGCNSFIQKFTDAKNVGVVKNTNLFKILRNY